MIPDPKSYRSWLPQTAVGVTALVLAGRLFLLVDRYAVNILFSDQWEFNVATVFEQHSLWQVFVWQHGPHRQGVGGVLAKLIEPHFQWDSRIESFVIAGILVIAMLLAVYLKLRLLGQIDYYDVVIPSLLLTATQCEVVLGAANLAHGALPLLLTVVYGLCWTIRPEIPRFAAVLTVNFLLIFTGFGLLMGVITPIALLASFWMSAPSRVELKTHLTAVALASLSVAAFFVHYTWNPAVDCYDSALVSRTPVDYLHFASLIYANYLGFDGLTSKHPAVWGAITLGLLSLTLLAIVFQIARARNAAGEVSVVRVIAFALMAFSMAFCGATAHGRICLGFAAAQESRYMPYLTPAFLGSYFYLRSILPQHWVRHAVLGAFLAVCAYAGWPLHLGDRAEISGFRAVKLQWKQCYLTNKNIAVCNRQVGRRICNATEAPNLQRKLDFLEREHLNLFKGQ